MYENKCVTSTLSLPFGHRVKECAIVSRKGAIWVSAGGSLWPNSGFGCVFLTKQ